MDGFVLFSRNFAASPFDVIVPMMVFLIPIIAILTSHQRKMTELHASRNTVQHNDLQALRQEMAELKDLVRQQTIALDGRPPVPPVDVRQRLGG